MIEDWSHVRSPSRAIRRLAQGHRQNIRTMEETERLEMEALTKAMHAEARTILASRAALLRENIQEIARIREDQP